MTKDEIHKTIIEAIEDANYEPRSYSGRGMYGKQCLGVVCESPIRATVEIIEALQESLGAFTDSVSYAIDNFKDGKTDNMGHDMILYWPDIEPPEDE